MAFVKTLGQSVSVAQAGYSYCKDGEQICKAILGGVCSSEELEDSITEMREKAEQCIKDASQVVNEVSSIRQELIKVRHPFRTIASKFSDIDIFFLLPGLSNDPNPHRKPGEENPEIA